MYVSIKYNGGMKIRKMQQPKNRCPKSSCIIRLVAKNVKKFRHQRLISQECLAELCELHRNYIGQIERCEVNISIITLEAIAKALEINFMELFTDD